MDCVNMIHYIYRRTISMTLGERLKKLRKNKKWTLQEVSEKLNLNSHSTYSNWEYDRTQPDLGTLSNLADIYDVSIDYLLTGKQKDPNFSNLGRELKFLRRIQGISLKELSEKTKIDVKVLSDLENGYYDSGKEVSFDDDFSVISNIAEGLGASLNRSSFEIGLVERDELGRIYPLSSIETAMRLFEGKENLYSNEDISNIGSILKVPIIGSIPAGQPLLAQEHIEEWTEIPNQWNLKEGEVFILKVKGDSMINSRIFDGDQVIVKIQPDVESGEIAVVNVNGDEATLKRVKKTSNGQTILYPDNPKYEPIFITNENARIVGKVVQVMFDPNKKL